MDRFYSKDRTNGIHHKTSVWSLVPSWVLAGLEGGAFSLQVGTTLLPLTCSTNYRHTGAYACDNKIMEI